MVRNILNELTARGVRHLIVSVWKSHATLTLLATQDCPLWLQYD